MTQLDRIERLLERIAAALENNIDDSDGLHIDPNVPDGYFYAEPCRFKFDISDSTDASYKYTTKHFEQLFGIDYSLTGDD